MTISFFHDARRVAHPLHFPFDSTGYAAISFPPTTAGVTQSFEFSPRQYGLCSHLTSPQNNTGYIAILFLYDIAGIVQPRIMQPFSFL